MKVKIVNHTKQGTLDWWYVSEIGKVFEVEKTDSRKYFTKPYGRTVLKEDAEVVEEVGKSCETCGNSMYNNRNGEICNKVGCLMHEQWHPIEQAEEKKINIQDLASKLTARKFEPTPKGCDSCIVARPCIQCKDSDYKYWVGSNGIEIAGVGADAPTADKLLLNAISSKIKRLTSEQARINEKISILLEIESEIKDNPLKMVKSHD